MNRTKKYGIILAGGKGLRMGKDLPKQFLQVKGRMILSRTLDAMAQVCDHLILVLPQTHIALWEELSQKESRLVPTHSITIGGETRFHSVRNGLEMVEENSLVAIHDGVRPYVTEETIRISFEAALRFGAAIPVLPVTESLRLVKSETENEAVNRNLYYTVQTPQCFEADRIKKAYQTPYNETFTDDASVYEHLYGKNTIKLVEGNWENIKITRPNDLLFFPDFID
ncbi:MAG: 2-C-methyl-D-erythritol 4-phosphate cytidylyltransferase [Porphyromonadaceae bacterium]|nr:2-C-methyl-D-erythritol 4-phosphate cytidylyltransferase [Porphyromonadaceae bacterium]